MLLKAHRRLMQRYPDALLVVVPRHPDRAQAICDLAREAGLASQICRPHSAVSDATQIVVVDTLGELLYFYGAGTLAYVGGSLVEKGGQNPLEPILAGAPVVSGPSVYNFSVVFEQLTDAGAVVVIETEQALADKLCELFGNEAKREAVMNAGRQVINANRGALQKILRLVC